MTRDNVPTTSVGDVAPGVQHKPGMANGLLGEIEPMSPDSPKNAASPATLGGEAPRATSGWFLGHGTSLVEKQKLSVYKREPL